MSRLLKLWIFIFLHYQRETIFFAQLFVFLRPKHFVHLFYRLVFLYVFFCCTISFFFLSSNNSISNSHFQLNLRIFCTKLSKVSAILLYIWYLYGSSKLCLLSVRFYFILKLNLLFPLSSEFTWEDSDLIVISFSDASQNHAFFQLFSSIDSEWVSLYLFFVFFLHW